MRSLPYHEVEAGLEPQYLFPRQTSLWSIQRPTLRQVIAEEELKYRKYGHPGRACAIIHLISVNACRPSGRLDLAQTLDHRSSASIPGKNQILYRRE